MIDLVKKYGMTALFTVQFSVLFYMVFDLRSQVEAHKQHIEFLHEAERNNVSLESFVRVVKFIIGELNKVHNDIKKLNDAIRVYDPATGEPYKPNNTPHNYKANNKPAVRIYPYDKPVQPWCPKQEGALFKCPPGVRVK